MNSQKQNALAEIYEDVEWILNAVVKRNFRSFGGDKEELKSEAHVAFMLAAETYDPECGTRFSSWLYTKTWRRLQDYRREQIKPRCRTIPLIHDHYPSLPYANQKTIDLIDQLTDEVKCIISIALTPDEQNDKANKRVLGEKLRKQGWSWSRIRNAFRELGGVLS